MGNPMNDISQHRFTEQLPEVARMLAGILGAAVIAFHPAAQGTDIEARLRSLVTISALSMHVHMAMIASVTCIWLSLAYLAKHWPSNGWVWIAVRLYSVGASAMLGAALISGFITGTYLQRALPVVSVPQDALPPLLLAFSANQVLAGFGTLFMSAAIAVWSMALVRARERLVQACGFYGIVAGAACVMAYAGGFLSLDVAGMAIVVVAHCMWYCLLGLSSMSRRRLASRA